MAPKDTSYRVRLSTKELQAAHAKARRGDASLAQVIRRLIRAWLDDRIELPLASPDPGDKDD
jgi:hypothetical protein